MAGWGSPHFKIREAVHIGIKAGEIWFTPINGSPIRATVAEVVSTEYIEDGNNVHLITMRSPKREFRVVYSQLQKVRLFLGGKDPSKSYDPWILKERAEAEAAAKDVEPPKTVPAWGWVEEK